MSGMESETMKVAMPALEIGCFYKLNDVLRYVDDRGIYAAARNSYSMETKIGQSLIGRKERNNEIGMEYLELPASCLARQIDKLQAAYEQAAYEKDPSHMARMEKIRDLLIREEVAYPILVWADGDTRSSADWQIREGMHRAVAMRLLACEILPIFVMRYDFEESHAAEWR